MSNVNLNMSIEEANLVLEALGEMPFRRVFELVSMIQQQASEQLGEQPADNESQSLDAVPDDAMAEAV